MLQQALETAFQTAQPFAEGAVATYIPELAKADPSLFGIAVATIDGRQVAVGDANAPFTIQSISKPLAHAWALSTLGPEKVRRRVGVEPSGDAFNSIILDPKSGRPFNPMVNAGAIALVALLSEEGVFQTPGDFLALCSRAAGRSLAFDRQVFESEQLTGNRNRAMAYLMLNNGIIRSNVEAILDLYFWQCSVLVTARDIAMIAATLANHGTNPVTDEAVFQPASIPDTLSVMFLCGMYDFAGEWTCRTGLPAKSGVAGGIIAIANRQLGLGLYSPRLDSRGNSVRGIHACESLSQQLALHAFHPDNHASNLLLPTITP